MITGTSQPSPVAEPPARTRSGLIVLALCFVTLAADGYDLIVYGASVLQLLSEPGWNMSPATAGAIGSWTLVGMMAGFLLSGPLTDRFGRRKVLIGGLAWFSIFSVVCALAQSPEFLGAARAATGIGLGAVIPSAVVLTVEFAPVGRRQFYGALMLAGYSVGGVLAALAALLIMPDHSWRLLFALAGVFLLVLPVMYAWLPESTHHLALRGRRDEARALAYQHGLDVGLLRREYEEHIAHAQTDGSSTLRHGYRLLFSRRFRATALIFAFLCFCSQLAVYGVNTWLPEFMADAGYPVEPSLQFFLVLQVGAVVGMIGGAVLADRLTPKTVMIACFLIGAVSLVALTANLTAGLLVVAVAGVGLGTAGTTMLLYGYAAAQFPVSCRGTAVGASMGIGRIGAILGPILGGWVLGSGLSQGWDFWIFAVPLAFAAIAVTFVPRTKTQATPLDTSELQPA